MPQLYTSLHKHKEVRKVISVMRKNEVIALHNLGKSARWIGSNLNIHRNTVNRYIKEYEELMSKIDLCSSEIDSSTLQEEFFGCNKMKHKKRPNTVFTGQLKERFEEIIKLDQERDVLLGPNKQKINAAVIYRRLKAEGYQVGETTIRQYFAEYKKKHPEVFIRQSYEPGQRMEYDFHQIKVLINNKERTYHQATISFPFSNHVIGYLFKDETTVSVMTSLVDAFEEIGGVPQNIVFDNMSTVVKKIIMKNEKEYTESILKLAAYYGFSIVTCNVAKGNEKGHVENSGKVTRTDFFSINYKFNSEEELMNYYQKALDEFNKSKEKEWEYESFFLKSKPKRPYVISLFGSSILNSYCCACIDTNFYSVPDDYAGKCVDYRIIKDDVIISYESEVIARHKKVDGSGNYIIEFKHFLKTFLRKPGAIANSLALKQAEKKLKTIYQNYKDNPREFILFLMDENKEKNSIESISVNQLNLISSLFGQEA